MSASIPTPDATRAERAAYGEPAPHAWARSGAMALTGHAGDAPRVGPARLASRADAIAAELCVRSGLPVHALDGAALLGERAAVARLSRRGRTSPGGGCRLCATARGDLAVSLARPDDVALLPAWLEREVHGDPWPALARALPERPASAWVERGRLLGLAVAEAAPPAADPGPGVGVEAIGTPRARRVARPLVVDLSSLWAGPLCAQLLGMAGARVVKVESTGRPDGARRGAPRLFDLLNGDKASVALDLGSAGGRDALRYLLDRADVVVEASRPRALRQLGIEAEAILAERPGLVWVAITGHGRREPNGGWVGFGDDAAVAAGLAVAAGGPDAPIFCADAVADPLAGMHAALETLRALESGGGVLLDVALAAVARHALGPLGEEPRARVFARDRAWWVACEGARARVAAPRARRPARRARPLGADTAAYA
ncbi:MAG TPA: CoA transferase [Myxococcota bacterium]|nr:CoA transferase [Myxococcota bacterium]